MQAYHYIWLKAHPERTEQWLQERLDDGFQIHHVDGDHFNDAVDNLLLIEKRDHFRLHRQATQLQKAITNHHKGYRGKPASTRTARNLDIGQAAYTLFMSIPNSNWDQIAVTLKRHISVVYAAAEDYAEANGLSLER